MTTHFEIRSAMATALQQSETVKQFCVENFGRGALVIVDWYSAKGDPEERLTPFIFITPAASENEAGFVDEETFSVRIVVALSDDPEEPTTTVTAERTATANGVEVNGIAAKVEQFRNIVETALRGASLGAVIRTITREEVSSADYPLEWAAVTVDLFEPQTL